jgi:hypothetical protein
MFGKKNRTEIRKGSFDRIQDSLDWESARSIKFSEPDRSRVAQTPNMEPQNINQKVVNPNFRRNRKIFAQTPHRKIQNRETASTAVRRIKIIRVLPPNNRRVPRVHIPEDNSASQRPGRDLSISDIIQRRHPTNATLFPLEPGTPSPNASFRDPQPPKAPLEKSFLEKLRKFHAQEKLDPNRLFRFDQG